MSIFLIKKAHIYLRVKTYYIYTYLSNLCEDINLVHKVYVTLRSTNILGLTYTRNNVRHMAVRNDKLIDYRSLWRTFCLETGQCSPREPCVTVDVPKTEKRARTVCRRQSHFRR